MEITGMGETKGLDSAQTCSPWNGPRQDWAPTASGITDRTCEGRYMGETNPVAPLTPDMEKPTPSRFYRDMPTDDGSWSYGKFPA